MKKPLIYLFALVMLSISIALIQNTRLGMGAWDALLRNFFVEFNIPYLVLTPIFATILVLLGHLIRWKKLEFKTAIPIAISTIIGLSIDISLLFVPSVINLSIYLNYLYLFLAMILISIAINVIIYCGYTLPALEQFITALSERLKISFGRAKLMGEAIAFTLTIMVGLLFHHQEQYFYIGQTTFIVLIFIGLFVDIMRRPTYKVLERFI